MTTPRLGFSFLYFAPRFGQTHQRWFERLAHYGYAGAELPVVGATDDELEAMRRALAAHGLAATAVGFATAEANPLDADAGKRRAAVDHLARLAEKTALLGADVLAGPIHSAYGRFTGAPPTADERARCIDVLRAAGERAAACGVRFAVEPLNRFECYFLNTAVACDALVRDVGHPSVCGALDTHHAHIEEDDVVAAITASRGTLGHVQLSENHRGTPGTGQVDFARVFGALRSIDYRGWLVIEAFSRQDPEFGSALRIWRELDGGPEEVLAAGAALFSRY
ncbi:MAG TPA: sugar phosphate isomerase/epimerase family protein [Planctomycetota bacterium]|nr:sugar phosphate isomerase/epimerase family protein [Planctomycetota bacterium]